MFTTPSWFPLWMALPLSTGMALQIWAALYPDKCGVLCLLAGAALVFGAALCDSDLILLLAQVLVIPLLWLRVRRTF